MREIAKKLKISYNAVYYSLHRTAQTGSNQNRKRSGRPQCTTEQEVKYIRVSSLKNRRLRSPQLAALLNSNPKTPISTSTVKRQLWDAGQYMFYTVDFSLMVTTNWDMREGNGGVYFLNLIEPLFN
jgi:transposase